VDQPVPILTHCFRLATDMFAPCLGSFSAMPKPMPVVPPKTRPCVPVESICSVMVSGQFSGDTVDG